MRQKQQRRDHVSGATALDGQCLAASVRQRDRTWLTERLTGLAGSRSGTTAEAAPTGAAGSGLVGLADRVEALGGKLHVTTLHVTLPLDSVKPGDAGQWRTG
jgi:hypothetical protein